MRLSQLRDYLDALMSAGVSGDIPVCIHDSDPVEVATEVADAVLLEGPFLEDPSPKLCGYLHSNGQFLLLQSCLDYDPLLNGETRHRVLEAGADVPAKTWPNGHWFDEPKRKPGQP